MPPALATLVKGSLSCRELAWQAIHLSQVVQQGAPENLQNQHALEAFMRALPAPLHQEVLQVDRRTIQEACDEAEQQEKFTAQEDEEPKPVLEP